MDKVEQLKEKLRQAEKEQQRKVWEEYLHKTEEYLKSIIGKTLMKPYQNGRFILFKVTGYTPQYYIDKNGYYGDWHPSRWFELKVSQSINCAVKDSSGKWFRPEVKYTNFSFNKITGKHKNKVETSKLDLVDYEKEKYSYLPDEVRQFGKLSYEKGVPDFYKDHSNFTIFIREVPEEMWKEAKAIADENLIRTKLFWDKYEPIVKSL